MSSTINFDEGNLPAGTIVTDQFENITLLSPAETGVMVFDTDNPTGEDYDLAAENLGNVLIISEDGNQQDPDDNATGGTIEIEFDEPSTVTEIGLLDIEESGSFIDLFDAEGDLIESIEIDPVGDGVGFELDLPSSEVSRLELNLSGSGALTSLSFIPEQDDSSQGGTSSEPILLTEIGWERDGEQLGTWSNDGETIDDASRIEVVDGVTANTLGGDDVIDSSASSGIGLLNQGTIITGEGNDLLQASVAGNGNDFIGIFNEVETDIETREGDDLIIGTVEVRNSSGSHTGIKLEPISRIDTGEGDDQITGTVKTEGEGDFSSGIFANISLIVTGAGDDRITGTVEAGSNGDSNTGFVSSVTDTDTGAGNDLITGSVIVAGNGDRNKGFLNGEAATFTGDGDDRIIGTVKVEGNGSFNSGVFAGLGGIEMGAGDDYLYGSVEVAGDGENNFGIENFNNFIRMGAGDDRIVGKGSDAYSGFNGTVAFGLIDLGEGDDTITGFGQEVVEGGSGSDTAEFEFSLDESVTFSSSDSTSIDITANEKTMFFSNVEEFVFANNSFTLDELIDLV